MGGGGDWRRVIFGGWLGRLGWILVSRFGLRSKSDEL